MRGPPGVNGLDQFYTTRRCAQRCYAALLRSIPLAEHECRFVEPSAGDGVFFDILPKHRRTGLDLEPRHPRVQRADFLAWAPKRGKRARTVVVGNPPFGRRGDMAAEFLNHAARIADTVGLILPMCFRKYAMQKRLPADLRLVRQLRLNPRTSFRLPGGEPYVINTEFQVWTRYAAKQDLRRSGPEPIRHPHFQLHQYNNTRDALKVFARPFDFAVPCQGWQDYSRRETAAAACEKNKQWMLLCAAAPEYKSNLLDLDYAELAANSATMVPGFRKCDLVEAYRRNYG